MIILCGKKENQFKISTHQLAKEISDAKIPLRTEKEYFCRTCTVCDNQVCFCDGRCKDRCCACDSTTIRKRFVLKIKE